MKAMFWLLAASTLILSNTAFAAGAIAVDDEQGETEPGYGFVTGYNTRRSAARAALEECRDKDNDNCKVVVRFDACGAYAASRKYYGVGWGETKHEAREMALDNCGSDNCRIIVAECED